MENHEHKPAGQSSELNNVYYALAIMAVILVGVMAYTYVQINNINSTLASSSTQNQIAELAGQVAQLNIDISKLQAPASLPTIQMDYYYDSTDPFTADALSAAQSAIPNLQSQGLQLNPIDVAGQENELKTEGFRSLPAIFVNATEAQKNSQLEQSLQSSALGVAGGYGIDPYGSIVADKTILGVDCSDGSKLSLFEYVDYACPTCLGPDAAVGEVAAQYNGSIDLERKYLTNDALYPGSTIAGQAVDCAQTSPHLNQFRTALLNYTGNLTVASLDSLAGSVGINSTLMDSCITSQATVSDVVGTNNEAYVTYGIAGNSTIVANFPTLVVDCKYVFPAQNETQIVQGLCRANSTWCTNNGLSS